MTRPLARASLLFILVDRGAAWSLGGIGGGIGGGVGDTVTDGGLVGSVGARGFRMLGSSCWDSDVWDQDFHLTRAMCAKTRSHRSWSSSSEKVVKKVHQGKCLTVVAIGSSMTYGNCMKCFHKILPDRIERSWPNQFKKWLDAKFPCDDPDGHLVVNLAKPASDAGYWSMQSHVERSNANSIFRKADMIVTDTAVTDVECQLGVNASFLELVYPPQGEQEAISPNAELLIRQMKALPNKPWIVFAELTWKYDPEHIRGSNHWDSTLSHLPILKYYDVDQVSLLDVFLNHQRTRQPWMGQWYLIDGGHATPFGHQIMAQVMAHILMEESHFMNLAPSENALSLPSPEAPPGPLDGLPEPLWMNATLAALYDRVAPRVLVPEDDPFSQSYGRDYMEWCGLQICATNLTGDTWPKIGLWVNLTWNETRPFDQGYVSVGLRRLNVHGSVHVYYHVMQDVCGGADNNTADYRVGLDFEPYWVIGSSLRFSQGFWFDLPPVREACLMMMLEWQGNLTGEPDPLGAPWKFLIDDVTVVA